MSTFGKISLGLLAALGLATIIGLFITVCDKNSDDEDYDFGDDDFGDDDYELDDDIYEDEEDTDVDD